MKLILVCAAVFVLLAGVFLLYRDYYVKRKIKRNAAHKYMVIEPLMRNLAEGKRIDNNDVMLLANDPSLRLAVYKILEAYNKLDLFPTQFFTQEKGAESFLVSWLEFPTELGAPPDEIRMLTKVSVDNGASDYYVFEYRTSAVVYAGFNWMLGVCGPYNEETRPFDMPPRIFSRFNTLDNSSPEREVQWVHEHIKQKH